MYKQPATPGTPAWYRQGWPWFLIALPASAVFGGIATLILALQSPNALVVDDYYKEGLAINQQIHRQAVARDMGLNALLRSDGRQLSLDLSAAVPVTDNRVILQFIDRKSTRLNSSHTDISRMPSSA